mgnify:CR=1 FL=1
MLKAIIADDEVRIIQLLRSLIDWEELGIEIVAEANNGMDALLYVKKIKPDILITDIRFPGIDGLELTKRVYEIDPTISTVIISGYKQFEYAHTALKYGVVEYLLKPINKENLENTLRKICVKKFKNAEHIQDVEKLKKRSELTTTRLRNQYIQDCLDQNMSLDRIENINKEYCYSFIDEPVISIYVYINVDGENYIDSYIIEKTRNTIAEIYDSIFHEYHMFENGTGLILIANFMAKQKEEVNRISAKTIDKIRLKLEFYENVKIAISVSSIGQSPIDLKELIPEVVRGLTAKCIIGSKEVVFIEKYNLDKTDEFLSDTDKIRIVGLVETFESEVLKNWILEKYDDSEKLLFERPWLAFEGALEIATVFVSVSMDGDNQKMFLDTLTKELMPIDNIVDLKNLLVTRLSEALTRKYDEKKLRNSQPVRLAKQYMQNHLSEQITIEDVANYVDLSYTYFSGLFKNETGTTVSQYLLNIRIEYAKKLIKETRMNLSEISESVGYSDAKHFSKTFKKNVKISFKEYKRLYS